jgi:pantoate--beta-alanine ligase
MEQVTRIEEMQAKVGQARSQGKIIGFVPTMGALHDGHLSLLREAQKSCDLTVVSIFVNPTQFNNPEDLEKYPRTIEQDLRLLDEARCDYVFVPEVATMYPQKVKSMEWDFAGLDRVMEGANRPGHFDGVATVVSRLFEAVPAHKAFFGEKDYQQLLIIRSMTQQLKLDIDIIGVKIQREKDGLAMSSRNLRLTQEQRIVAPFIYQCLLFIKENLNSREPDEWKNWAAEQINSNEFLDLEYIEFADAETLQKITAFEQAQHLRVFVVVHAGTVRLIDNLQIF